MYYRYYGPQKSEARIRAGEDRGPNCEGGNPSGSRTNIQDVRAREKKKRGGKRIVSEVTSESEREAQRESDSVSGSGNKNSQ